MNRATKKSKHHQNKLNEAFTEVEYTHDVHAAK